MIRSLAAMLFALLPLSALSEPLGMQSDWLELVKGERCEVSGAQIMAVRQDDSGNHSVMVKVPKAAVGDDPNMEEVRVVGRAPEDFKVPVLFPELETEWVEDYDNDHYGLLVKLNSDQRMPFRLFFSAEGQGGRIDNVFQP